MSTKAFSDFWWKQKMPRWIVIDSSFFRIYFSFHFLLNVHCSVSALFILFSYFVGISFNADVIFVPGKISRTKIPILCVSIYDVDVNSCDTVTTFLLNVYVCSDSDCTINVRYILNYENTGEHHTYFWHNIPATNMRFYAFDALNKRVTYMSNSGFLLKITFIVEKSVFLWNFSLLPHPCSNYCGGGKILFIGDS